MQENLDLGTLSLSALQLEKDFNKNYARYKKIVFSERPKIFIKSLYEEKDNLEKFFNQYIDTFGYDYYRERIRITDNHWHKKTRVNKMVDNILCSDGIQLFLTFTFTDTILDTTTATTRRRYVQRFLHDYCIDYIGNIDYGKLNGREHYHAVVVVSQKLSHKNWKFGTVNFKKINVNASAKNMASYLVKFTAHATKNTTDGSCRVLTPRKK